MTEQAISTGLDHPSWSDGMGLQPTQCTTCRHYRRDLTCNAYPRGIPADIYAERVSHRVPQPGDHGIQWAPAPPAWTDGPVLFVPIHQATARGWKLTGALWVSIDGQAMAFEAAPEFEGTDTHAGWVFRLQDCWNLGRSPRGVFAYYARMDTATLAAGRVRRAASIDQLRARLR